MAAVQSPLLRIPSEIRLMIYDLLFDDKGHRTFEIRHESPKAYKGLGPHRRTSYRILTRSLMRQSLPTTYHLVTDVNLATSILSVDRKINEEATHQLYGCHSFGFGGDIEAVVPFFSDLRAKTRFLVNEISLVKQGYVYSRDYDRCEWSSVCEFIREKMRLSSLKLVVEGGRPSLGWKGFPGYTVADFKSLSNVRYEALEWVWELLAIKGISRLDVTSEIHHCPPSHSSAMAFFAAFSASIETGFAEYLRAEMGVTT